MSYSTPLECAWLEGEMDGGRESGEQRIPFHHLVKGKSGRRGEVERESPSKSFILHLFINGKAQALPHFIA